MRRIKDWFVLVVHWALCMVCLWGILMLGGCAQFDNRVACTMDGKKAFFVSEYSGVGITSKISDKDLPHICGVQGKAVYLVGEPV